MHSNPHQEKRTRFFLPLFCQAQILCLQKELWKRFLSLSPFPFALPLKARALNFVRNSKRLLKWQHMAATQAAQSKAILWHTNYYPHFQDRVFWVLDYLNLPARYELKPETSRNAGGTIMSVHECWSRREARNTQWIVEHILGSNTGQVGPLHRRCISCLIVQSNPLSP